MKKALIISGLLVSAFLFAQKANAQVTHLNNASSTAQGLGVGSAENSSTGGERSTYYTQIINRFSSPVWTVSDFTTYACSATGGTTQGTPWTYAYIFSTQDQYNQGIALNTHSGLSQYASSTSNEIFPSISNCGGTGNTTTSTQQYTPINYTFATPHTFTDGIYAIVFKWYWQGSASVANPVYKTVLDTTSGFPSVNQGKVNGTLLTDYKDYAFILSDAGTSPLEILEPTNNSTVNDIPLTIGGTCENDVELFVYDGVSYASSTNAFGTSLLCSVDDTWETYVNLTQGYWNVYASSTEEHDGIVFYYRAQSFGIPPIDLGNNPLASTEGAELGYWSFLNDWASRLLKFRPYSYFYDLQDAFQDAFDNPTSTVPVMNWELNSSTASTTLENPFDITLTAFQPSQFTSIISQEQWDSMQWIFKILITLPWLVWFVLRIKRYFGI